MDQGQYLQDRVEVQIKWYDDNSNSNQCWFKTLRFIEIVSAAMIPFIAGYIDSIQYGTVIIGFLGVLIAICAGMASLNKYQENWLIYRTTCEALTHEKILFTTGTKPYDGDAFNQFVERVESLLSKENKLWARESKKKLHNEKREKRDATL